MENKIRLKGGLALLIAAIIIASSAAVNAATYVGNVFISTAVLNGGSIAGVFSAKPNQGGGTPQTTLQTPNDYVIQDGVSYNGVTYDKTIIFKGSPVQYPYILFTKGGFYSIAQVNKLEDKSSPNIVLPALTYYKTGSPDVPKTLVLVAGFETAKATWGLNTTDFELSGVDLEVAKDVGFTQPVGTLTSTGVITSYAFGELVDGRKLDPGTNYWFHVRAKVDGVAPSAWTNASDGAFTTKSGGIGSTFTINIKRTMASGLGINSFSVPKAVTTVGGTNTPLDGTSITTAYDLCDFINKFYGASKSLVRSFGTWDETVQIESGATINYSAPGVIDAASSTALKAINLQAGRGYQAFVKPDVDADVSLTFTLQ